MVGVRAPASNRGRDEAELRILLKKGLGATHTDIKGALKVTDLKVAIKNAWLRADKDSDGSIDWTEFGQFSTELKHLSIFDLTNAELRRSFSEIDVNKDGKISRKEIESFLRMRGLYADLRAAWITSDTDKDGLITWPEFGRFVNKLKQGLPLWTSELPRLFKAIDQDGDGFLSRTEVERFVTEQLTAHTPSLSMSAQHFDEAWNAVGKPC